MNSQRHSALSLLTALFSLLVLLMGCGSEDFYDPNESEATRAIREKVRADMESERLGRIGNRLAFLNDALADSPTAYAVSNRSPDAGGADSGGAPEDDRPPIEIGEELYTKNCGGCHGPRGNGDGPLGASLVPQPAKHSDGTYMNALSDEHIFKVIQQGGAAVGKSSMMAPWGPSLSDDQIRSLIVFIRTLADPPYPGSAEEGV